MGEPPNPMHVLPRTDSSRSLALWTLAALLLVAGWDASGLDLPAARLLGGPHGFALQNQWLLTKVLHQGVLPFSWLLVLWITLGVWWPTLGQQRMPAPARVLWAMSSWIALLVIDLMKLASRTSCPWDLAEFGGNAVHVSHWAWGVLDGGAGHCFPAGHATAGFVFLTGFFAWRQHDPALARRWLLGALLAGGVLGLSQQLRGAHFASHTLWTAWICWTIAWAAHALPALFAERVPVASKVPQAVLLFWVVKILATTMGETAGDAVSRTLALGYAGASLIFLALFALALALQLRTDRYRALAYWTLMAASTTAGTTIADYLNITLGLGHFRTALLLAVALALVLVNWRRAIGRVAVDEVRSQPDELFYWSAILLTSTLGTALADCVADVTGFVGGALVFAALLALVAALHARRAWSPAWLFWSACVLTRPLGAMLGDVLTETHALGGLALGRISASLAIAALIVLSIALMSQRQQQRSARAVLPLQ
jgi:uncharacterized membrane-anchored protein/membrane-associated PAP2 superfamily phosphatase